MRTAAHRSRSQLAAARDGFEILKGRFPFPHGLLRISSVSVRSQGLLRRRRLTWPITYRIGSPSSFACPCRAGLWRPAPCPRGAGLALPSRYGGAVPGKRFLQHASGCSTQTRAEPPLHERKRKPLRSPEGPDPRATATARSGPIRPLPPQNRLFFNARLHLSLSDPDFTPVTLSVSAVACSPRTPPPHSISPAPGARALPSHTFSEQGGWFGFESAVNVRLAKQPTQACQGRTDRARGRFTSQHAHAHVAQGGVHAAREREKEG
ncbi:hypothetical protein B0J18DRAFT_110276 [Chaetomium sp. MPI-SDFR-AT-0129]|nr:hypothetical protein B0J18DRAFT_110276 [Chaetomium sp. MPI-SDFR-AT-0129]